MPPKVGSGGKARANNANNDSANQQRTIQTRSARAGLQVCNPFLNVDQSGSHAVNSFLSVVYTVT